MSDEAPDDFHGTQAQSPEAEAKIKSRPKGFPDIPGYEILSRLGKGGMGVVWLANDIAADRLVAIKQITSLEGNSTELGRFKTEVQAMSRMKHPNIAQYFTSGEHEGQPYFVLEYCSGGNLAEYLNRQP